MNLKYVTITLGILNVILLIALFLLTQTTIFDVWFLNKVYPRLCTQEQTDGKTVFTFCGKEPVEATD